MSDDDRRDRMIRELAEQYHRPPETPRAEIWARIQAERAARPPGASRLAGRPRTRWLRWGLAVAATLAVGIAIGRFTAAGPDLETPMAGAPADTGAVPTDGSSTAYRLVAAEHLARVETFLSVFSAEASAQGMVAADFEVPARQLLRRTRLLRTSPVADDVPLRALLDDVEFVLLQIASFAQGQDEQELGFIEQGINERSVLLRLRSALPTLPGRARAEGAL